VLAAGIAPECYSTPNTASVNMGPRYSSDGAVQYVLAQGANKIAFDQSNVPGTDYISAGPNALAKAKGVAIQDFTENVPITSANAIATKLVTAAGPGGAVVLNFTPPEALLILQAAQKLNLENRVKYWACSTPCNTDFLATSLGPKWNNKLFVNSELLPLDGNTSQTAQLFQAVLKQYGTNVSGGVGSFSEMGFTMGEIATKALESVKGDYTIASVSAALKGVTSFNTGMLCQGFTYGNYPTHLPNNMDYTVTPNNGKMVIASTGGGCTLISADDPQVAAYRAVAGTAPAVG
jgi:branched-chain amino acid transport system substrate-binding protein